MFHRSSEVERRIVNPNVEGSNPSGGAKENEYSKRGSVSY